MLKDLLGDTLQGMLEAEMDEKLGYSKYDYQNKETDDCRNGYSKKWLNCVCVDSLGNLIIPDKLTQRFGNLLKANGLRHIRFHDLRHSCASFLVSSGIPMKQVQLFLGHSNYSTTADIYAHLSPNALDASGATMQSLLAPKAAEDGKEVVSV